MIKIEKEMTLEDLGYTIELETFRKDQHYDALDVGRVVSEHRERYIVKTADKEYECEIIGNLRFSAHSRSDFPAYQRRIQWLQPPLRSSLSIYRAGIGLKMACMGVMAVPPYWCFDLSQD